jgi:hypothetical protein
MINSFLSHGNGGDLPALNVSPLFNAYPMGLSALVSMHYSLARDLKSRDLNQCGGRKNATCKVFLACIITLSGVSASVGPDCRRPRRQIGRLAPNR